MFGGGRFTFLNNVTLPDDGVVYVGDPNTDGSWRKIRVGNNWQAQRRESGTWVKKSADTE